MPKVPVYEQQVRVQTPRVSVPALSNPVEGAFGRDIAAAGDRLGQTVQGIGDLLSRHMIERRRQEDQRQILEKDTAFRKELQNTLYSNEQDENGRPKGYLMRNMAHAKNATPEFDQTYQTLRTKYVDAMGSDAQKEGLARLLDNHFEQSRGQVIRHQAGQENELFKETFNSNLKQRILDAGAIQDPVALARAIDEAQAVQSVGLKRMGSDEASIQMNRQILASEIAKSSFNAILEKNPKQARALFDAVKEKLPETAAADMSRVLDGKEFSDLQISTWNKLSGMKLADGNPDFNRLQNTVLALDLPTEKKEKLWDYVKARAGEEVHQKKLQESATNHQFQNEVIGMKNTGRSMQDALALVGKYPGDNVAKLEREQLVHTLWTKKTFTDPEVYNSLWLAISDGAAGRAEINQAYLEGKLSSSDWIDLGKRHFGVEHKNDDVLTKAAIDRVQMMADEEFGSNKKAKHGFIYMTLQQARGKAPEEILATGKTLLEKDPAKGFWIWGPKQYESDLKFLDAENDARAKIIQDVGKVQARGILESARSLKKGGTAAEIMDEFSKEFGGYQNLKAGTPVNRAIELLQKNGQLVTPANVRAVLKKNESKE